VLCKKAAAATGINKRKMPHWCTCLYLLFLLAKPYYIIFELWHWLSVICSTRVPTQRVELLGIWEVCAKILHRKLKGTRGLCKLNWHAICQIVPFSKFSNRDFKVTIFWSQIT